MKTSIIIPTYNRRENVGRCLDSILKQTMLPEEILVVDDSENSQTKQLIEQRYKDFDVVGVHLRYVHHEYPRSMSQCENLGAKLSVGDIILILDDDVVLEEEYIKEIEYVYEKFPYALGVQGYITNGWVPSPLKNFIRKWLFIYSYREKDRCRVRRNITHTSYPYEPDHIINCEWLSGCNNSWRRSVFDEFQFDEQLLGSSFNEDVDFSYRVYKKYPNQLFMNPKARVAHYTVTGK